MTISASLIALAILFLPAPDQRAHAGLPEQSAITDLQPDSNSLVADRPQIDRALRARDWGRAEKLLAEEIDGKPPEDDKPLDAARDKRKLLVLIARVFFLDGKPLNAAVALKKADAIAPLEPDLRFMLVLAYVRLGQGEWARPELERLVQIDPEKADYRYWLGRINYDSGKYAAAISHFEEALARNPGSVRIHDNLGLCYEALDDVDRALAHYRDAIRLNREAEIGSPWPPTNLGILLRQRGQFDEAAALFGEALRYDANFAKGHYELGNLLDDQGQRDRAVSELERAAAIDPSYPEPHYVLARLYRRQGQVARADEALAAFFRLRAARERKQP